MIPPAKAAGKWISQIVARNGIAAVQASQELESAWHEIVGEALARRTRIGAVRRGVCEVTVEHSSLLQQISFQQRELVRKLQQRKPHFGILSLKLRVGPVGSEAPPPANPSPGSRPLE